MAREGDSDVYEVICIRKHAVDRVTDGRLIFKEGDEYYPSSCEWGKAGWTYTNLADAARKFEELSDG